MRMTFDKMADAAYIYFKEINAGEVTRTISLNESINIDLDAGGRTLGIEILDATKNLPRAAIASAEIIG
jgi:uncharacterized protein YuzE